MSLYRTLLFLIMDDRLFLHVISMLMLGVILLSCVLWECLVSQWNYLDVCTASNDNKGSSISHNLSVSIRLRMLHVTSEHTCISQPVQAEHSSCSSVTHMQSIWNISEQSARHVCLVTWQEAPSPSSPRAATAAEVFVIASSLKQLWIRTRVCRGEALCTANHNRDTSGRFASLCYNSARAASSILNRSFNLPPVIKCIHRWK